MTATKLKVAGEAKRLDVSGIQSTFNGKPIQRKIAIRGSLGRPVQHTITVQHDKDPKLDILERIGEVPAGVVQFSQILVAIYMPPRVTKSSGGVIFTDQISDEDWGEAQAQGKTGLVVSCGPQAYVDDESVKFHGTRNEVGDWVWFRPSDGMPCEINGVFCRVFSERHIIGKIPHPDYVW